MKKGIPVLAVAAWSGSGKTVLLERMIGELSRKGIKTAVIKHDGHDFEIDKPGKDTWRFAQAGAETIIISSASQTAMIERKKRSLMELVGMIKGADIILVEGYKNEPISQIGLCRKDSGNSFTDSFDRYVAVVTDLNLKDMQIPVFSLEDIEGIVKFVMEHKMEFTHSLCFV